MKKFAKYLILSAIAMVGLSSCEDFLEVDKPLGQMDAETLFSDPNTLNAYLNSAFSVMGKTKSYRDNVDRWFGFADTDIERWKTLGSASNEEASMSQYNMAVSNTKFNFDLVWGSVYTILGMTNEIIDGLKDSERLQSDVEIRALYAKALTYRAYFYYDLIRWFGDVPARFETVNQSNMYLSKMDRHEIYDQIIADLKLAEEYIDWADDGNPDNTNLLIKSFTINAEFPTKGAIKAFRARISLAAAGYAQYPISDPVQRKYKLDPRGGEPLQCLVARVSQERREVLYAEARDACAEIIAKYPNKLNISFEQVFRKVQSGQNVFGGNEVLWQMRYESEKDRYMGGRHASGVAPFGIGASKDFGGRYYVLPHFFYDFEEGDTRRYVTCLPFMWNGGNQSVSKVNEISFGKKRKEWLSVETPESGVTSTPTIVIRYADVLLMYAEAAIGGISGDVPVSTSVTATMTPQEAFDAVRARAGLTPKPLTMENIIQERAFEFAGEQLRQADLIRWGILKAKIDEAKANLVKLKNGEAPYHWVPDNIFVRTSTRPASDFISDYFVAKGVTITALDFYGYNRGEIATSVEEVPGEGWRDVTGDANWGVATDARGAIASGWVDYIYVHNPDERQLYPITIKITSSNNLIKDDYGYYTGM